MQKEERTYRIVFTDGSEVMLKAATEEDAIAAALEVKHQGIIILVEEIGGE